MKVLVVENIANTSLGQVGRALRERGVTEFWSRPYGGEALPESPDGFAGIVVLGGEQNARADDTHPYLPALARLMAAFGAADLPVLGICLGSQLLARAHGADNHIGTAREFGWQQVTPTAEAKADPVLSAVEGPFSIFQWHSDTFTLPQGAVRLATNPNVRNQAFRIGRASYGTQFHFEASSDIVKGWNSEFGDTIRRINPHWHEDFDHHVAAHGDAADRAGLKLARAWAALL